jgi:hypothetical protein
MPSHYYRWRHFATISSIYYSVNLLPYSLLACICFDKTLCCWLDLYYQLHTHHIFTYIYYFIIRLPNLPNISHSLQPLLHCHHWHATTSAHWLPLLLPKQNYAFDKYATPITGYRYIVKIPLYNYRNYILRRLIHAHDVTHTRPTKRPIIVNYQLARPLIFQITTITDALYTTISTVRSRHRRYKYISAPQCPSASLPKYLLGAL